MHAEMKNRYARVLLPLLCIALGLLCAVNPALAVNSDLYSQEAVSRTCIEAQKTIASTALEAYTVNHRSTNSFIFSSSAPYEGPNLSAYNGKNIPAGNLPLTVQQYVFYGIVPATGWRYPETVTCKMKDSEAINFHFGAGSAGALQSCRVINEQVFADVFANLTSWESRTLAYTQADIVFEDDLMADNGPVWTSPLPVLSWPVIYLGTDGLLHVRSKALAVERTNPTTDAGADKKGVYYCHLPSPEHVLNTIRGLVPPCTNDSFCIR